MQIEALVNESRLRRMTALRSAGDGQHLEIARKQDIGVFDHRWLNAEAHSPLEDFQRTLDKAGVVGAAEIDRGETIKSRDHIAAPESENSDISAAGLQHAHTPGNGRIGDVVNEICDPQR